MWLSKSKYKNINKNKTEIEELSNSSISKIENEFFEKRNRKLGIKNLYCNYGTKCGNRKASTRIYKIKQKRIEKQENSSISKIENSSISKNENLGKFKRK